uniref:Putative ovule protein n=1 Tax=Solanum chacoense TaxID=4108 RepID=A0A0V0H6C7_SOLCH
MCILIWFSILFHLNLYILLYLVLRCGRALFPGYILSLRFTLGGSYIFLASAPSSFSTLSRPRPLALSSPTGLLIVVVSLVNYLRTEE